MKYLSQQLSLATGMFTRISSSFSADDNDHTGMGQSTRVNPKKGVTIHICHSGNLLATLIILLCCAQPFTVANAKHNSQHPLTNEEWQEVMERVSLLDDAALIPSLLPVIMRNRDALELSEAQLERFLRWRKENYINMVNIMNEVIEKRIQFRIESLTPAVNDAYLIAFQEEIQRLERELLKIRLACRAIVMETFTREQWETFEFIVADDPVLASLISLRDPAQSR